MDNSCEAPWVGSSGVDDSDDITDESVGSSASPGVGRSVYSLDERLGLRKVATRTSVAFVCEIGEVSKSLGITSIGMVCGSIYCWQWPWLWMAAATELVRTRERSRVITSCR